MNFLRDFIAQLYEEKKCAEHAKEGFEKAAQGAGFPVKHMEIHYKTHKVNMDVQLGGKKLRDPE